MREKYILALNYWRVSRKKEGQINSIGLPQEGAGVWRGKPLKKEGGGGSKRPSLRQAETVPTIPGESNNTHFQVGTGAKKGLGGTWGGEKEAQLAFSVGGNRQAIHRGGWRRGGDKKKGEETSYRRVLESFFHLWGEVNS